MALYKFFSIIIINIIIIIIIIIIIYFYGLRDTFEVDTDHKPLLPLFASHKVTARSKLNE